jgi:RNA polymerase sigma-70 factor (family 1)
LPTFPLFFTFVISIITYKGLLKNSFIHTSENLLIKKLIEGDQKAFSQLFNLYAANLLNVARKYLINKEEAEEIVQETFYRVWKYRENMDAQLSFKAYIITIAKRLIFNQTKKRMHEIAYQEYFVQQYKDDLSPIEEYIDFHELDRQIKTGIESLPPKCKETFLLSRQHGLSNHEIANKLNISLSTVENHMNKALNHLRKIIAFLLVFLTC